MEIKKSSWLYKVAYGANADVNQPSQGNLCKFFWKFIFMVFLGWPAIGALFTLLCLFFGVAWILGFFFAARPRILNGDPSSSFGDSNPMICYRKWPNIKGVRILPIYLVLAVLAPILIPGVSTETWTVIGYIVGGIAVAITLIACVNYFFDIQAGQLFKKYLAAKKAKVCPLIKFTNE